MHGHNLGQYWASRNIVSTCTMVASRREWGKSFQIRNNKLGAIMGITIWRYWWVICCLIRVGWKLNFPNTTHILSLQQVERNKIKTYGAYDIGLKNPMDKLKCKHKCKNVHTEKFVKQDINTNSRKRKFSFRCVCICLTNCYVWLSLCLHLLQVWTRL